MKQFPKAAAAVVLILAVPFMTARAQTHSSKPHPKSGTPASAPATAGSHPSTTGSHAAAAGAAGADRLDGIAAVVNDDVILESDVEEQLYLFIQGSHLRPDSTTIDSMRTDVLKQLIDFRLVVAEAKRQGLSLNSSDDKLIDQQADESLQQARARFQSDEEFQQALERENTSIPKLREKYQSDLREQLLAQRLRDRQVPKRTVSSADAEAFFKANPGKFPKVPAQVKLQVIQIPPVPDSIADVKAHARILEIRKRLTTGGEKFAKVAADVSEDENTARSGGDLGFLPRGALDASLDQAVASARLNELSAPVRSSAGWHLFEVLERDTLRNATGRDSLDRQGNPIPEAHLRHILIRVPLGEVDIARARAIADRVHAEAVKGADFGDLARRFSKYQGQADPDGDLGYVSMGAFQPDIRAALDSVVVGSVSRVLENPIGFNLFKVNDRKPERAYQLEEVKDELPRFVEEMKDRERWEAWIKTLHDKAHIEIRGS